MDDLPRSRGLLLAGLVLGTWAALHIWSVFLIEIDRTPLWLTSSLILLLCWLSVGLFIVAHDAMHGSLAPGRPGLSRAIGRLCLFVYAGFSFDRLLPKHMAHHRHAGTAEDPDFHAPAPRDVFRWYGAFFRQYFGLRELAMMSAMIAVYLFLLGARYENLLLFWALPSILSSMQLFFFGTYLPHCAGDDFVDRHRARSADVPVWASLLSCYHFGYHHEHHRWPHVPWWGLPAARRRAKAEAALGSGGRV
ncbi:fatty acid desaturase [Rhizorhabdus sp.]|uniref:fatty acid desaturase n=1 Tax=Rhizorhabdus sp. TaxID=1968843 RepID=UPI0025DEA1B4|nr:fatty acid desaturase [Rhizorhabdus sp.]